MPIMRNDDPPDTTTPEEMAVEALIEAMPFLKLLEQAATGNGADPNHCYVNGYYVDIKKLSRLIGSIETGLSGYYPL